MTGTKVMSNNLDEIMKALEEGVHAFMESDTYKTYLRAVSKFHNYSTNNILLISMQRPDATLVAGYNTWRKSFNRNVKRGEKGIKIIAPMPVSIEKEEDRVDQYGNTYKEKVTVTVPRFHAVTVFDVAQTEGEPLPDIRPEELKDTVNDYETFLKAVEKSSSVPISYEYIEGGARGYFDASKNAITVGKGMGEAQTLKTLIHEMGHSVLHNKYNGGIFLDSKTKEVEAESIAFSVCSHFGIDTSDYTFPYVTAWAGGKDSTTLRNSMDTIKDTASLLIHRIEDNYKELTQERTEPGQHKQKGAER